MAQLATPSSNTGFNRQDPPVSGISARCDYLVIVGCGDVAAIEKAVHSVFGTNFDWEGAKPGTRGQLYATVANSAQGIELAVNWAEDYREESEYRLSIPGAPIAHCSYPRFFELCKYLHDLGGRCSRFDWCVDDYDRLLDIFVVASSCERDCYSRVGEYRYYQRKKSGEFAVGRTIYLGSSSSDKQIRIYDKNVQSKGEIDSIRYEVQWRSSRAETIFGLYSSCGDLESGSVDMCDFALGAVDFVERSSTVLSRCKRLPWWEEFCRRVGNSRKLQIRVQQRLSLIHI